MTFADPKAVLIESHSSGGPTPEWLVTARRADDGRGEHGPGLRALRALALRERGELEECLGLFESARELATQGGDAELAARCSYWCADTLFDARRWSDAIVLVPDLRAISADPAVSPDLRAGSGVLAGRLLLVQGEPDASRIALLAVAGLDEEQELSRLAALGEAAAALGDEGLVDDVVAEVCARRPSSAAAIFLVCCEAALAAGRVALAVRCGAAARDDVASPPAVRLEARVDLGMALWHAGQLDEALVEFGAVQADPATSAQVRALVAMNRIGILRSRGEKLAPADHSFVWTDEPLAFPLSRVLALGARANLCLFDEERYSDAVALYDQALAADQGVGSPWLATGFGAERALALAKLGRFDEALRALDELEAGAAASALSRVRVQQCRAVVLAVRSNAPGASQPDDAVRSAKNYARAGEHYATLGRPDVARDMAHHRGLALAESGDWKAALGCCEGNFPNEEERIAFLQSCIHRAHSAGFSLAAVECADHALATSGAATPSSLEHIRLLRVLGIALLDGRRAIDEADALLAASDALRDPARRAQVRVNRLGMKIGCGMSISEEERVFLFDPETLRVALWSGVVHNTRVYYWLARGSAEAAIEAARQIDANDDDPRLLTVDLLTTLALAHASLGQTREARVKLAAAERSLPTSSPSVRNAVLLQCGRVRRILGDISEAEAMLRAVIASEVSQVDRPEVLAAVRVELARTLILRGDPVAIGEALPLLDEVLNGSVGFSEPGLRSLALWVRGVATASVVDLCSAAEIQQNAGDAGTAATFWDSAARAARGAGDQSRALALATQSFSQARVHLASLPSDAARVGAQHSVHDTGALLVSLLLPEDPLGALRVADATKSAAFAELYSRGTAHADRGVPTGPAPTLDAARLCAALPPQSLGVEYFIGEGELVLFILRGGKLHVERTAFGADDEEALATITASIVATTGATSMATFTTARDALRRFDTLLIGPLQPHLADVSRLFIAAGGRLAHVPFAALLDEHDRPLVARGVDVTHLFSFAQLEQLHPMRNPTHGRALLVRGDDRAARMAPLAHADSEIRATAALLTARGLEISEPTDTEELLREVATCDLIHYSGHGRFDAHDAMNAAIFPPGGDLTATRVLDLDLRHVRLVTLSACETGRTSADAGDEVLGFLRALFAAGAGTVLCSRWVVSDASASWLLPRVYERWLGGAPLDRALGDAARDLIATGGPDGDWRHILHWGNFQLYGLP